MKRVVLLVDGFNLYHSLNRRDHLHRYKWLDLQKLAAAYITPTTEALARVYFFTSLPPWDAEKKNRHSKLIAAYKDLGIQIVYGSFQQRTRTCRVCDREYASYEEKLTDINIAVHALRIARRGEVDRFLLLTADSDQAPMLSELKEAYPEISTTVLVPPFENAEHLRRIAGHSVQIKEEHLKRALLSDPHVTRGGILIVKPARWGSVRVS